MAEFALCLPLLVMILFAVFQFGIVFVNYIEVSSAAREGARAAAVSVGTGASVADVEKAARDATGVLDKGKVGVVVSGSLTSGQLVKVTVTYPYSLGIPGLAAQADDLTSEITARVE